MLEELMRECRNWFVAPNGVHHGVYTIKDGSISLPFLVEGQYFRIIGSVFNDGVYKYGAGSLTDETFDGTVWALAVPAAFISLVEDVEEWRNQYESAANSPFQSESFAGYSYTMKSEIAAQGGSANGWHGAFSARLNKWRKL
uniref:Uncharacterized protein n=1 Tax=Siphoviridae sp. ctmxA102 TaxID=2825657 RepID=A0A8S5TW38_9CAUD|nr:MAG TPA: hypothetical protein [Siphoviridae sp. ctmxA102]